MSYNFYTSAPPRAKKKERGEEDEIVNNAYAKIWSKFAKQPETEAKDKDGNDDDDEEEEGEEEGEGEKKEKKVYIIDGVEIDAENTFLNFTFLENLPREIFVDVILSFVEPSERLNFLTALWQTKMPRLQGAVRNLFRNKKFYEQIKPDQDKFVPKNAFDNQILTPALVDNEARLYRQYLYQFLEFVTVTSILKIIMLHNSPIVHFFSLLFPWSTARLIDPLLESLGLSAFYDKNNGLLEQHVGWGINLDELFYLRISCRPQDSFKMMSTLASSGWTDYTSKIPGYVPKMPDLWVAFALHGLCFKKMEDDIKYNSSPTDRTMTLPEYVHLITQSVRMLTNINFTRKGITEFIGILILLKLKTYSVQLAKSIEGPKDFYFVKNACEGEIEAAFNSLTPFIDVKHLPYPPKWIIALCNIDMRRRMTFRGGLGSVVVVSILGPLLMKFLRPIMKLDRNDKLIDGRIQKIYELVNEKNRVELQRTKDRLQGINTGFENITFDDIKVYCCSEYEKRFKKKAFKEEIEKSIEKTRKKMNDVRNRMTNVEKVQADFKKLDRRLERTLERINKDTEQRMKDLQSGKQHFGKYTKPVIEEGDDEIIKESGEEHKKREKERINKIKLRRVLKEMQLLLKQDHGYSYELDWLISKAEDLQHATRTVKFDSLLKKARETLKRWILNY